MLKRLLIAAAVVCAALSLTSCFGNDYLYSGLEMVNVVSQNRFQNDDGIVLNVVENEVGEIPPSVKRIMISFDVFRKTDGKENEYDIRLRECAQAMVKDPVPSSEANPEEIGNDVLRLNQAWMTKGYFNALAQVITLSGSEQEHTINLVFNEERSHKDTLFFSLKHNAFGDSIEPEENRNKSFNYSNGYFSFPVNNFIPEGTNSIVMHIDWEWYKTVGDTIIIEREVNEGNINYQP